MIIVSYLILITSFNMIVLALQDKLKSANEDVLAEICKLNVNFQKLESELSITKNTKKSS